MNPINPFLCKTGNRAQRERIKRVGSEEKEEKGLRISCTCTYMYMHIKVSY